MKSVCIVGLILTLASACFTAKPISNANVVRIKHIPCGNNYELWVDANYIRNYTRGTTIELHDTLEYHNLWSETHDYLLQDSTNRIDGRVLIEFISSGRLIEEVLIDSRGRMAMHGKIYCSKPSLITLLCETYSVKCWYCNK